MKTELLLALGLALGVAVLAAVLLLRRGKRQPQPLPVPTPAPVSAPAARPVDAAPTAAALPPAAASAVPPALRDATALLDAQRQATTEALRLARQRKAEDAARAEAARQEAARAEAQRLAAERQAAERMAAERQAAERLAAERQAVERQAAQRLAAQRQAEIARAAMPAPVVPASPAPAAPPRSPAVAVATRTMPPVVLVADDSKVVRVKTGRLLEKQGWQVLLAEDGEAALRLLDTQRPDLLITDVEMPGLDGFGLTRSLRAHARGARLPVIMITSSDERHRAEAAAAGVDLLLGKPYGEDDLLAHVRRLLHITDAPAEAALH